MQKLSACAYDMSDVYPSELSSKAISFPSVGRLEGALEGFDDGALDGSELGLALGVSEGSRLGIADGVFDGLELGCEDGRVDLEQHTLDR